MQCVANCDTPQRRNFEQPLLQTLTMSAIPLPSRSITHAAPPGSPERPSVSSSISSSNLASIRTVPSVPASKLSSPTLNAPPTPTPPTYPSAPATNTIQPGPLKSLLSFISPAGEELACFGYRPFAIFSVSFAFLHSRDTR